MKPDDKSSLTPDSHSSIGKPIELVVGVDDEISVNESMVNVLHDYIMKNKPPPGLMDHDDLDEVVVGSGSYTSSLPKRSRGVSG